MVVVVVVMVVVVDVVVAVVSWELHFQFLSHAGKVRPQQNLPDRETFKGCPEFSWTSMTDRNASSEILLLTYARMNKTS